MKKRFEGGTLRAGPLTLVVAIVLLGGAAIPVHLTAQNASSGIVTFDAPGSIPHGDSFDGTFPSGINNRGTVTGIYMDANTLYHGFTRSPGGEFTTLDAPGAATSVGTRFRPYPNGVPSGPNISTHSININNPGRV